MIKALKALAGLFGTKMSTPSGMPPSGPSEPRRFRTVVYIGIALVILNFIYGIVPQWLRVISLPLILSSGWLFWARRR